MAVALYARVSTPRQAEKDLSIPDQLRQMREYCKAQNLPIAGEYVEPGASAHRRSAPGVPADDGRCRAGPGAL